MIQNRYPLIRQFTVVALVISFGLALISCTPTTQSTSSEITVQLPDPNRIRFSGKGAGAGMMLMSSMGPMGIAIGVAIDEGIGKEIQAQLENAGSNVQALLTDAITHRWPAGSVIYTNKPADLSQAPFIQISEYGFKMMGKDELAIPYLEGNIQCDQGSDLTPIAAPEYLEAYAAPLEKLKQDGPRVKKSLEAYLNDSFVRACMD